MTGPLRLERHRRRERWARLTAPEKKCLAAFQRELEEDEAFPNVELVDVVDEASGETRYVLACWPFGSGVLVDRAGTVAGDVAQHGFQAAEDPTLTARLGEAWARDRSALGIAAVVHFPPAAPGPRRPPATPADRIARLRRLLAEGGDVDGAELRDLVKRVFAGQERSPVPVRPLSELAPVERDLLELLQEGPAGEADVSCFGLPPGRTRHTPDGDPGHLARYLGRAPSDPLAEPLGFAVGAPVQVWCAVQEALFQVRPGEAVVDAVAGLPAGRRGAVWLALARLDPGDPLIREAAPKKGAEAGSPAAVGAHVERYVRWTMALAERLGAEVDGPASALLAELAPSGPGDRWLAAAVALGALARRARHGVPLGDGFDALVRPSTTLGYEAEAALAAVLEDLPPERSARLAAGNLALMARFHDDRSAREAVATWRSHPWYHRQAFERCLRAIGPSAAPVLQEALAEDPTDREVLEALLASLSKGKTRRGSST